MVFIPFRSTLVEEAGARLEILNYKYSGNRIRKLYLVTCKVYISTISMIDNQVSRPLFGAI